MLNATNPSTRNLSSGAWLIADMALNIWALTIVKALGLGYSPVQLVFLRACVGLIVILPWVLQSRRAFKNVDQVGLHLSRVVFSALALTASFFALPRLPFALVTAISFTRPILMMIFAGVFLNEVIGKRRWIAAGVAFVGVLIAVQPSTVAFNWGLPAMAFAVFFGTSAIILTRRLVGTSSVVMMTFYTAGLAIVTLPFASLNWSPIAAGHLVPLLAIGVFSQSAQFCFLRAHSLAEAGFLSILGYLNLLFTAGVGYIVFNEVPTLAFAIGAALIVLAAVVTTILNAKR